MAAGVALAAALPRLPYACGLGTVELLATDVAHHRLVPVGGSVPVGPARADDDLVAAAAAAPERVEWWRQRVAACHARLREREL
jgi:O-succinylbenzoate synthase